MSFTAPVSPDAKPVLHRIDPSTPKNHHTPNSPATPTPSSSPTSPKPRSPRSRPPLASDSTFFSRIRSSRSRSPAANRANSTPTAISSPPSTARRPPLQLRSETSPSTDSITRTMSRSQKRHSGTVMQCGRHGNEWLFGGFSLTEAVRGLISPTESEDRSR